VTKKNGKLTGTTRRPKRKPSVVRAARPSAKSSADTEAFSRQTVPPITWRRMQIRILLVEDDKAMCEALERAVASLGYEYVVAENSTRAVDALSSKTFDLCVVSLALPAEAMRNVLMAAHARKAAIPFVVRSASNTVKEIVSAFRMGAVDFIPRPFHHELCGEVLERALVERGRGGASLRTSGATLIGEHPAMQVVLERVDQVADSSASVLIRGEEGTGKEVVARLIHACGGRRGGPFVTVRLAGGEALLAAAELFGTSNHPTKSATATDLGKLEEAQHGTLFIDEIANLSRELQMGLLRLIRDPAARTRADVRIVAATTRNLEQSVR